MSMSRGQLLPLPTSNFLLNGEDSFLDTKRSVLFFVLLEAVDVNFDCAVKHNCPAVSLLPLIETTGAERAILSHYSPPLMSRMMHFLWMTKWSI